MRTAKIFCCVLGLLALPALAAASVVVSPASASLAPGEATPFVDVALTFPLQSLPGAGALEIAPPAALIGTVTLEPDPVTYSWGSAASSARTRFRLRTSTEAPPGTWTFRVSDETLGAGAAIFRLTIRQPGFAGRAAPSRLEIGIGGAAGSVRVSTLPEAGFDLPVTWRVEGLPGFIRTGGAPTSTAPGYPDVQIELSLGAGARAGTFRGTVRGSAPSLPAVSLPLTVEVTRPSFEVAVEPARLTLVAGGAAATARVLTRAPGVVSGAVTYRLEGLPAGVTAAGSRVSSAPRFAPLQLSLQASRDAAAGEHAVRVRGVFEPGGVTREATLALTVRRPAPRILAVRPGRVVRGSSGHRLEIAGADFAPGARVETRSPALRVREVEVVDPGRIALELDVRADAPPGPARLDVVNPDGQRSPTPGVVAVLAEGSLAAPLTVHSVAVLHPAPGALLAAADAVRPRGVLVVSGSGPLVVSWRLDGVAFERIVVQARGGEPVAVEARAPIPTAALGQHLVQLVVEGQREIASAPVAVVQTADETRDHRLLAPPDGRVVPAGRPPLLTWTQVAGSSGYVVEVEDDEGRLAARWPAREARLRPSVAALRALGHGVFAWRVRATFAGGAVGDPTSARRLVLLPESVELVARVSRGDAGGLEISWSGGAAGLLYRVECVGADGEVRFAALTADTAYALPVGLAEPEGAWRVLALAPDGAVLGRSAEVAAVRAARAWRPGTFRLATAGRVELLTQSPADGSVVSDPLPAIGAEWDGTVEPADVLLVVDDTDVTAVADLAPGAISFAPFLPLDAGVHAVELLLGERAFRWSFTVEAPGGGEAGWADVDLGDGGRDAAGGEGRPWLGDFNVTGTWLDAEDRAASASEALATVSVSGQQQAATGFVQANVDLSARRAIEPDGAFEEQNRSWVVEGARRLGRLAPSLAAGYTAPDFLVGSELLTAGLPRGGAQAALGAGPLRAALYQAFDPDFEGVVSGLSGAEQELKAAVLEWPEASGRFDLRLIGIEVDERPDEFFAGGEGSLYGLYGSWQLGQAVSLTVELARGEFKPGPTSLESVTEGDAARLALSASRGAWDLDLAMRWVDPEFVNPASRGLAVGGIPDRRGADLRLGRSWGGGSLGIGARRFEGGAGPAAADSSLSGADLSLYQQLGERLDLSLAIGYALTESAADAVLDLPAVEQTDWNVALGLSERLGRFVIQQDLSLTESDDRFDAERYGDSAQLGLSVQRDGEVFRFFGLASAVRSRFGEARVESESVLVTVQPSWSWARTGLSVTPYASYSRFDDDFSAAPTTTESYRLTLTWGAPHLAWLTALQLAGDWSRTEGPFALDAGFVARYTAAISIGWGSGRSPASDGAAAASASIGVPASAGAGLTL